MTGRPTLVIYAAALAAALALVAWASPPPQRVTDRDVYEATAAHGIVPDCTDIHCFRVLVPWTLGMLPGPSIVKWKAYAVVCSAAAAVAVFQLCLTLGCGRPAAWLASFGSAFGFGALYTLHDPYTSDPLIYALGPAITNELLRGRAGVAALFGAVGVLAKEFAAAPLYIVSAAAALDRRWTPAARALLAGQLAFIVWLVLQLALMLKFNYGYDDNPSTHLLAGGYLVPWLGRLSPRGAASALVNEYGALYLVAPVGFLFAPPDLKRLALAAAPVALLFAYVQQPDRALWNVHFLMLPLAALVLARTPPALAWTTMAAFAAGNLRVGAQLTAAPPAWIALVVSGALAVAAIVVAVGRQRAHAIEHSPQATLI